MIARSAGHHPHGLLHPFRITLVTFIEDLGGLRQTGLEKIQCDAVLACLDAVVGHLKKAPSSSTWLGDLSVPFNDLRSAYYSWNYPEPGFDQPSHRAAQCKQLRTHKDGMLSRYTFGPLLAEKLEIEIFTGAYDEFIKLENIKAVAAQPKSPFRKTVEVARKKRSAIAA